MEKLSEIAKKAFTDADREVLAALRGKKVRYAE